MVLELDWTEETHDLGTAFAADLPGEPSAGIATVMVMGRGDENKMIVKICDAETRTRFIYRADVNRVQEGQAKELAVDMISRWAHAYHCALRQIIEGDWTPQWKGTERPSLCTAALPATIGAFASVDTEGRTHTLAVTYERATVFHAVKTMTATQADVFRWAAARLRTQWAPDMERRIDALLNKIGEP